MMFKILVDQYWGDPAVKDWDYEWVGSFIWGTEFNEGEELLFDHPQEALRYVTEEKWRFEMHGNIFNIRLVDEDFDVEEIYNEDDEVFVH